MSKMKLVLVLTVFLGLALAALSTGAPVRPAQAQASESCALLDDPAVRGMMSAMFERKLLEACGRLDELPAAAPQAPFSPLFPTLTDVIVNDPSGDTGTTHTQSESSIAVNENNGTICSGYNDSFHGVTQGQGYSGFSRSIDGGATFQDRGPFGSRSGGDPSMVWRRSDGNFYFATIDTSGTGFWRSTDDCLTFQFLSGVPVGDDKELMAIDNYPSSPYYGRIYVAATNFGAGGRFTPMYSDTGATWSTGGRLERRQCPRRLAGGGAQRRCVRLLGALGFVPHRPDRHRGHALHQRRRQLHPGHQPAQRRGRTPATPPPPATAAARRSTATSATCPRRRSRSTPAAWCTWSIPTIPTATTPAMWSTSTTAARSTKALPGSPRCCSMMTAPPPTSASPP